MMDVRTDFTRSDGATFSFGDDAFKILELTGVGAVTPEIFTKKRAVDHGSIVTGFRIPEREWTVKAEYQDAKANREALRQVNAFFNPTYTFDVTITYLGDMKVAKNCHIHKFDNGAGQTLFSPITPSVTFLTPDAFFFSADAVGKNITGASGGLVFPYHPLVGETFIVGVYAYGGRVEMQNDGDIEAYIQVQLSFTGTCTGPGIYRDDAYIKLLGTFNAGDTVILNAYDKSVTLNGKSIAARVEKGSRWADMVLSLGKNSIEFRADSGTNNVDVYVFFNKRYLSIN